MRFYKLRKTFSNILGPTIAKLPLKLRAAVLAIVYRVIIKIVDWQH
jgi:hypothetical protein